MKRYVYINDDESSQDSYCDNRISNRKYNALNFLPKNLLEQFSRFMNQYFLLIACLQLWSLITPVNPASTWGPLIFIFAVSASKEAWDDYNRYLSDKKANEKKVWVVKHGIRKQIQAQDIHVGNIVWLRENDEVPCDLVLLGTSDQLGLCYIETSALDGETDLKTRVIPSACLGIDSELLHKIKGVIECPNPDKDIRKFDANLRLFPPFIDNDLCPLTIKNTVLQSCYLRNTEWACGVAMYTGNETKLGMSRGLPEPKLTAVDAMIDKLTGAIFVFQIVVVIVLGVAGNVWKDTEARKQWYVLYPSEGPWYELLVIPLRFELLCSIMIPISIKVSLDLVKSLYAKFIDWDSQMTDDETGIPAHALNTAISEDLGQVEYILTDKTGTLTENKMIFRRCCISGIFYGNESGNALKDVALLNAISSGILDVTQFLTVMAICNTVVPVETRGGTILYKAQSQDEDALVQAAAKLHMVFLRRASNTLEVNFNGSIIQYEILDVLEFTSNRKRMSVVVKECQNGKIVLLSKGADEAILPYAFNGQQIRTFTEAVDQYAQLGLRTLCLAWREVKEDEYQEWSLLFKEANSTLVDREWRLAEVCQQLEHDLIILGVTAIEDRLQEGVPETIETLRKAGINFWMLTGDKQDTAIQIARSCNFISPVMSSAALTKAVAERARLKKKEKAAKKNAPQDAALQVEASPQGEKRPRAQSSEEQASVAKARAEKKVKMVEEAILDHQRRELYSESERNTGVDVEDVDVPLMGKGASVYVPNWGYTYSEMPYDSDATASDVLRKSVFPRDVARLLAVPMETLRVKAEADAYRSSASVRALGERLELQYGSLMSSEDARDALKARVEALERERQEMFLNEQKLLEEREELRKVREELIVAQVECREARDDADMWNKCSKVYEDKYNELRSSFGTFDKPGPLLMQFQNKVSDDVVGRLADEVLSSWEKGFRDCKKLTGSLFPDLDLSEVELDEPYPEEGEPSTSKAPPPPEGPAPEDPAPPALEGSAPPADDAPSEVC